MKKIFFASLGIFTAIFFFSCQKSADSPSSANITGTWTFVSMDATTSSSASTTQGGETDETVTQTNYTTENNTGTVTIDGSTMTTNNVAYSVNTTARSYYYINNVLSDSIDVPFNFDAPASSGSMAYHFVGSDSIYFDQGTVFMNGVTQNTLPSGCTVKLQGDMLYLTQTVHQVVQQEVSGVTVSVDESGTITINLKKQ
jgi:hypothetical protein